MLEKIIALKKNLDKKIEENAELLSEEIEQKIRQIVDKMDNTYFCCGMGTMWFEIGVKNEHECYYIEVHDRKDIADVKDENLIKHIEEVFDLMDMAEQLGIYADFCTNHPPVYRHIEPRFENDVNNEAYKFSVKSKVLSQFFYDSFEIMRIQHQELYGFMVKEDHCNVKAPSNLSLVRDYMYNQLVDKGVVDGSDIKCYESKFKPDEDYKKMLEIANTFRISTSGAYYLIEWIREGNKDAIVSYIAPRHKEKYKDASLEEVEKLFVDKMNGAVKSFDEVKKLDIKQSKVLVTNTCTGKSAYVDFIEAAEYIRKQKEKK